MAEIISAVYKIINTITGNFYIGSSKNVKRRWVAHKCQYTWNKCPNNPMYLDMQKYGLDYFEFEILANVEPGHLKQAEQHFIETLHPTYNNNRAKGWDFERYKKTQKKSDKRKKSRRKAQNKYNNQLCSYNGEILTLHALAQRFQKAGIEHPTIEARKYLVL